MNRRRSQNRRNPFREEQSNASNQQPNVSQSNPRSFPQPNQYNNPCNIQPTHLLKTPQHSPQKMQANGQFDGASSSQQQSAIRLGPCVLCKFVTALICSRCGDFYCSLACQKKDWQDHRFICFAMPKLVPSSTDIYQNLPALDEYEQREFSESSPHSQNRKWINDSSTALPAMSNNNQPQQQQNQQQPQQQNQNRNQQQQQQQNQNRNQQQEQQQQQKQQQQQQQQKHQQQQQKQQQQQQQQNSNQANRQQKQKAVNGSEKSFDLADTNKATNVGRVAQSPFPKNKSRIQVSAVRTSNRVFVRSIEEPDNNGYCEVLKTINEYGKHASPLTTLPGKNAFALTNYGDDGVMYRVQVVSVKDADNINVIYFDFGNEATKKLSELKDISVECATLKQYIHMASLKGVPFVKDNPKLIEYIKSFEDSDAQIIYTDKDKPQCEIILEGHKDSLNKKINVFIQNSKNDTEQKNESNKKSPPKEKKQQQTTTKDQVKDKENTPAASVVGSVTASSRVKSRPSQFVKPVMTPPFEQIMLPIKEKNINVMIVDNSLLHFNCFGCVAMEDKPNLQKIQSYLDDYEDNGREYKPKIEEYCLAKYQDGWYRAKVLEILSPEIVEVVFIDFLNESEISMKNIRRYPMDLDLPCKTTLCMIEGLPEELTEIQVEYLKNKLQPGTELKINEVVEKHQDGSDIAVCKINQITQWMREDKP